jgi:maltodextrin utilization protein YvdJ
MDMLTNQDLDWLESTFLPKLADTVKDKLKDKLDEISTKLDKFVGDVKTKREEQTLHNGDHQRIDKRVTRIESHLHLQSLVD